MESDFVALKGSASGRANHRGNHDGTKRMDGEFSKDNLQSKQYPCQRSIEGGGDSCRRSTAD